MRATMSEAFIHDAAPPPGSAEGWWFAFQGGRLLVMDRNDAGMVLPRAASPSQLGLETLRTVYLGRLHGEHCFSAEVPDELDAPAGMQWQGLRGLFGHFDEHLIGVASRAFHVIDWDRTHQFCGRCGKIGRAHV